MSEAITYHNHEHYADPTAHGALSAVQSEQDEADIRVQSFIRAVKTIIDQSGYELLARIEIKDRHTGRCYR